MNGQNGCKLYLNPKAGRYIKIETAEKTYYISGNTAEETEAIYAHLKSE